MEESQKKKRNYRAVFLRVSLILVDILAVNAAYFIALLVRFYVNSEFSSWALCYIPAFLQMAPWYTIACLLIFAFFRLYNTRWKYVGLSDMNRIFLACLLTSVVQVVGSLLFVKRMPISYYGIGGFLQFVLICVSRFSYRIVSLEVDRAKARKRNEGSWINVMVVGVGETAHVVLKHLERDTESTARAVCVVDFRSDGFGDLMEGVPVLGGIEKIRDGIQKYAVECVILADTTMPQPVRNQIRKICEELGLEVQDFAGYFQDSRGPVTMRGLMECATGEIEVVLNGAHKCYPNGEQALTSVPGKNIIKAISARNSRLVVELQPDVLVPNDVKEDWVRSYEQENGEDISFF